MESYRELFERKIPLKAHVHRTDDILTAIRIAKEGYPAIVGPSLASRSKIEVCMADFKTAGVLKKSGVTVAITMDHPVSRIQFLPLCAALAAKEGIGEKNAIKAITIDAAKICGVEDRLGSLKVGKDADIALFNKNPLKISTDLFMTIINGEVVWRNNKIHQ